MKRDDLGQTVSRSSSTLRLARPALNYSLNLKHHPAPAPASRWNDVMVVMMPVAHLSGCQWPGASDQRATDNNLDLDCCLQVVSHLLVVHSTVLGLRRRRYYILHTY